MAPEYTWRGPFAGSEVNRLHAIAFGHPVYESDEWDWRALVERHSLGWVVARDEDELIGFVNVVWDGLVHAWLQDVMVAPDRRREGIGTKLVLVATEGARSAGCEWLHVDFDEELRSFYIDGCGFEPAAAGLKALR